MRDPHKTYYYIDIHLKERTVLGWGESSTATHSGDTEDRDVHRMFLPVGQYNKLIKKLE